MLRLALKYPLGFSELNFRLMTGVKINIVL
jgi:hypothetical protein